MKIKLSNPYQLCLIFLILLACGAVVSRISTSNQDVIIKMLSQALIIFSILLFEPYITNSANITKVDLKNTAITSIILFLIIDPQQKISTTLLIIVLTLIFKIFLRYKHMPIINPAVSGLLVAAILHSLDNLINITTFISWWGVSYIPRFTPANLSLTSLFILPIGVYLSIKTRRFPVIYASMAISILGMAILAVLLDLTIYDALYTLFEGTFLFAVSIMLAEPKTSPNFRNQQIIYAGIFSISYLTLFYFNISGGLVISIVIANIYNLLLKGLPKKAPPNIPNSEGILLNS